MDFSTNLFKDLSELGIVVVGFVLFIRTSWAGILQLAKIWKETNTYRNTLEEKHLDVQSKVAEVLERVTDRLNDIARVQLEHLENQKKDTEDIKKEVSTGFENQGEIVLSYVDEIKKNQEIILGKIDSLQTAINTITTQLEKYPQLSDQVKLDLVKLTQTVLDLRAQLSNLVKNGEGK